MPWNAQDAIPTGAKLLVFRNQHKEKDADPDYTLHLAVDDDATQSSESNPYREHANNRANAPVIGTPTTDNQTVEAGMRNFEQARQQYANDEDNPPW